MSSESRYRAIKSDLGQSRGFFLCFDLSRHKNVAAEFFFFGSLGESSDRCRKTAVGNMRDDTKTAAKGYAVKLPPTNANAGCDAMRDDAEEDDSVFVVVVVAVWTEVESRGDNGKSRD